MAFEFPSQSEVSMQYFAIGARSELVADADTVEYAEKDAEINATRRALVGFGAVNASQIEASLPERDSTVSIYNSNRESLNLLERRDKRQNVETEAQDRLLGELLFGDDL